ncbi:MAG: hypothetical protein WBW45_18100, partial [Bradyrhizobium sp.]
MFGIRSDIGDLHGTALQQGSTHRCSPTRGIRNCADHRLQIGRHRRYRRCAKIIADRKSEVPGIGVAEPSCLFDHRFEDRFQIARRRIDDAQHFGSRGLSLQRLLRLVEQARVFDGNRRLVGKGLHQIDLAFGERTGLGPRQHQHAFDLVVPEHRHAQRRANSDQGTRGHLHVRVLKNIRNNFDLSRCDDARGGRTAARSWRIGRPIFQEFG